MKSRKVKIADLKVHPLQKEVFSDLPVDEFESLKRDIEENGLRHPLDVATDMTIVDGHQRVRACEQLGFTEIAAIVHDDWDKNKVDQRFIETNLNRRQLDPVGKARVFKALYDLERKTGKQLTRGGKVLEFRDYVAAKLGCSGRTADRYQQLLRLPSAIQDAVSRDQIALTTAIKMDSLSKVKQQQIMHRIENGEAVKAVIKEFVDKPELQSDSYTTPERFEQLVDIMREYLPEFESNWERLCGVTCSHGNTTSVLNRSGQLFNKIHDRRIQGSQSASTKVCRNGNQKTKVVRRPSENYE